MLQTMLPAKTDELLSRIYAVAMSLDTVRHPSSLVKARLRGLTAQLHDELQHLARIGFDEECEAGYHLLFDVLGWLTSSMRFPGIRRGDLAHAISALEDVRALTLSS